jgi:hypothetical protein
MGITVWVGNVRRAYVSFTRAGLIDGHVGNQSQ